MSLSHWPWWPLPINNMARLERCWHALQMELAGFPPHIIVFSLPDYSTTIFGQLQLMSAHGL